MSPSDNISKIICRFRKENSSTFEIIYQSILLHQNLVSLVQLLSSRIVFKKFTPYFGFHVISLPVIQVTSFQAMEEFPLIILEEFQKEYLFTGYCSSWTPLNSFQLYKLDSTDHSNDIVKESLQIWKGKIESICKSAYSRISKIEKKWHILVSWSVYVNYCCYYYIHHLRKYYFLAIFYINSFWLRYLQRLQSTRPVNFPFASNTRWYIRNA